MENADFAFACNHYGRKELEEQIKEIAQRHQVVKGGFGVRHTWTCTITVSKDFKTQATCLEDPA